MAKLWAGRTSGETSRLADDFNSSLPFDCRMYREDIAGSIAHAAMLGRQGIITESEADEICAALDGIRSDLDSGRLAFDFTCEDIHMFVEQVLTERIGQVGKKLHTARSRNDQVALDVRMYLRREADEIREQITELILAITDQAEKYGDAIMPGYTHLQRAQPVTFGHYIMAYASMLMRDLGRLDDAVKRMNVSPIGCCALAGTTYPTDRESESYSLGFDGITANSIDGVSDRDFVIELLGCLSLVMMHLSRLSEEIVLYTSWEFRFIELDDSFTTGSSIMPQKKNSDMAELVRGKTGRVYGDLVAMLTVMKGLPLAYNKDMQEDKEGVFDAIDTVKMCLPIMTGMIKTMTVKTENMRRAANEGFINATDLADYLVSKGLPFRDAYKVSGAVVAECIKTGCTLETFPLDKYKAECPLIDEDVYRAIDLDECVRRRISAGGTSPASVGKQIKLVREEIRGAAPNPAKSFALGTRVKA